MGKTITVLWEVLRIYSCGEIKKERGKKSLVIVSFRIFPILDKKKDNRTNLKINKSNFKTVKNVKNPKKNPLESELVFAFCSLTWQLDIFIARQVYD